MYGKSALSAPPEFWLSRSAVALDGGQPRIAVHGSNDVQLIEFPVAWWRGGRRELHAWFGEAGAGPANRPAALPPEALVDPLGLGAGVCLTGMDEVQPTASPLFSRNLAAMMLFQASCAVWASD